MGAATAGERVRAAIAATGRITFAEFMEIALYAPGAGYYTASSRRSRGASRSAAGTPGNTDDSGNFDDSGNAGDSVIPAKAGIHVVGRKMDSRFRGNDGSVSGNDGPVSGNDDPAGGNGGPASDYYTAPQLHAVFGTYLARHVARIWQYLGEPEHFDVVEMGAGRGILAWDILRGLREAAPRCWERARYRLVERGPGPNAEEMQALAAAAAQPVVVSRALAAPVVGVVLSNELLDALPAHRVRVRNGELQEVYVTLRDGRLCEEFGAPSCPELTAYVARMGMPPEGWQGEISLAAVAWLERVAQALRRGTVITIDYGATWDELCGPRFADGTLACYYRHRVSTNPYARVGAQDITAHVNFSALMDAGARLGLRTVSYQSQAEYLTELGIGKELAALARQPATAETQRAKRAITDLIWPDGLGGFRVLAQVRDVL